ncbi:MAG: extracellular solute-binding protein [Spirochaetota bacterium]
MHTIRRLLLLSAAITLIAGAAFAGGAEETQETETYRFSYATGPWDVGQGRIDVSEQPDHRWFQYVEEELGVVPLTQSWEWEGSEGYLQGLRLALAGGEEFEAIMPWSPTFAQELIDAGQVIPLDDLITQFPNIEALYSAEVWDNIRTQQGGQIYYIPQPAPIVTARPGFIRRDWLERVDMDVPTTRDELVEVYRAFLEEDANGNGDPDDEIPVSGRVQFRWFDDLFIMHGVSMFEGHPHWSWNEDEDFFESHQVSDEMFAAVQFISELYEEGLMDVGMPAQSNADWSQRIADDRVGHYFHLINEIHGKSAFAYDDDGDSTGREHWAVLPHPPVVSEVGEQPYYFPNVGQPRFMITTDARDPEAIMRWLDWSVSPEGMAYSALGIPGVEWEENEDGEIVVLEEVQPVHFKYAEGLGEIPDTILSMQPMGELKIDMIEEVQDNIVPTEDMFMPATVYSDYADFAPSSATMYRETIGQMITGELEPTEENWEEYRERWYEAGGQVVTDRATEWYRSFYGE